MMTADDGWDPMNAAMPEYSVGQGENCAATGTSEIEQRLKQVKAFTRCKIQNSATMENLPDEILLNIFVRLLARQLAQMRSVSKSWNALLSHPSFVKSHLHRSIRNNKDQVLMVFRYCYESEPVKQYSSQSPHLEPINIIKHTPTDLPMNVIGSVNGLICFSEHSYSNIRIWNPSLSAVSAIPPPQHPITIFPYVHYLRFGFDPKTDDYKLVKISGIRKFSDDNKGFKEWQQVEVYSMRKGSWGFITQPFPSHITCIYNTDALCVDGHDGHFHWQTTIGSWRVKRIVAFDLGSETFREMHLPNSILDSSHGLHHLGVLGGKLCEMTWRDDGACEVWVMEEYGVSESWVKRHVFPQFNDAGRYLFGFTSRNELLVGVEGDRLGLYDPIANKIKLTRSKQSATRIVEYVDSLVWI